MPTMRNFGFYGVGRKLGDYTSSTISNARGDLKTLKLLLTQQVSTEPNAMKLLRPPRSLKLLWGKCVAWDSSSTELSNLYSTGSPSNCYQGSVNSPNGFARWSLDAPLRKPSHIPEITEQNLGIL